MNWIYMSHILAACVNYCIKKAAALSAIVDIFKDKYHDISYAAE